jgi:predicted unusual protein kinase regulating ubiquinone biosynthesis (AarF/ABC1/UbiB family)
VAQKLLELFITGLYDLRAIHADPNPGNFIIDDLAIALVVFGCIKRLDPAFVAHCRRMCRASAHQLAGSHFEEMVTLGLLPADQDEPVRKEIQGGNNSVSKPYII